MTKQTHEILRALEALGFSYDEANRIRRIEMTLHRWAELECGDGNDWASWAIERDETTNVPYMVTYPHTGESRRRRIADRETGALRRLQQILKAHPEFTFYHQTDPRGSAIYILRQSDLADGADIQSVYTRGFAV